VTTHSATYTLSSQSQDELLHEQLAQIIARPLRILYGTEIGGLLDIYFTKINCQTMTDFMQMTVRQSP
jgi:hypothetical protein